MINEMYPFWAAILSCLFAQCLKPLFYYIKTRKWRWTLVFDSGGLPSSHAAMVSALTLAVGLIENFNSTIFAVTLVLALVVIYDAANIRFYAGRNIQITQQLIKDFQSLLEVKLDDPIYLLKIKDVLGHKWIEVASGIILGLLTSGLLFLLK